MYFLGYSIFTNIHDSQLEQFTIVTTGFESFSFGSKVAVDFIIFFLTDHAIYFTDHLNPYLFNVTILHLEYRLCPEHPLLASVDDTVALYHALLRNNISPSQILIMRDSGGGGLSLLTIQTLITRQLYVPRGVIVLSPWADLSGSGEQSSYSAMLNIPESVPPPESVPSIPELGQI
ncbi:unnamed protein product [Rotaria socialis]|uniref:Alpha/beta hydrolase fold-3 domain-containing protein n=1 Tax=Rotaria socialis TaxID=392032 RepID=A0A820T458_9BILA|nr:unnamed protein product [Rotaria socialis]CAF3316957.1 unnamed protein product [Rotaria socialis]CAF3471003.1 unnamed protein product [Rotaria socialis]CAF3473960.1 unnamed protein product [Rotaria socialis]CAF4468901.1 unnamed protein product [Rotaria socialis]